MLWLFLDKFWLSHALEARTWPGGSHSPVSGWDTGCVLVVGAAQPWGSWRRISGDQQNPKLTKGSKGKLLPVAMRPTSSFSKISGLGY